VHLCTSDEYFRQHRHRGLKYDLILLEQTYRDFVNSLHFAHGKTMWIIDDVVPNDVYSANPDSVEAINQRKAATGSDDRSWHGDVYKTVWMIRTFHPNMTLRTFWPKQPQALVYFDASTSAQPATTATINDIGALTYDDTVARRSDHNIREEAEILEECIAAQRQHWDESGYLVLEGFFPSPRVEAITREFERSWDASRLAPSELVVDLIGTSARVLLHQAPIESRKQPYKLNDLYLVSEDVRHVVLDPQLVKVLWDLLGGTPLVCNSLNFEYGSQQPYHTDSLYMTPPRDLNLTATWIALEDCVAEAGPLRFFPGSHKIPPYRFSNGGISAVGNDSEMPQYQAYMQEHINRLGLKERRFCARAGDVFIWHSQLYHGGAAIDDPTKSRRSLVTHYFIADDMPAVKKIRHVRGGYWMKRAHQAV
jgi:ectoine hydroxylase-related dioxygenase (phytanoyl-CoA dioxygenase family)